MFGNVTALVWLHVTGKYRDTSMLHTCARHAAWDPHTTRACASRPRATGERTPVVLGFRGGLAFEVHRLLYHLTLGPRAIKKEVSRSGSSAHKKDSIGIGF